MTLHRVRKPIRGYELFVKIPPGEEARFELEIINAIWDEIVEEHRGSVKVALNTLINGRRLFLEIPDTDRDGEKRVKLANELLERAL
jgi:hypothetical protein